MSTLFSGVRCLACQHRMPPDLYQSQCSACGSPWLDALYDYAALPRDWPSQIRARPTTLARYRELLPLDDAVRPITLGEGWTPLLRAEGLGRELEHDALWIKDERQQPTGSFKDRQAALTVSALRARGVDEMVLASTGNAAAAYAAFCARAGIKLWVFLTSSVPAEKMRELALYGAEVVKITGTYDQAKSIAANFAARRGIHLDGGAKAIPGKESMKTLAYEIAEQFDWQAPDWYVQAVSGGIGPLGVHKGFVELFEAGLIDRVPKLGIVQVTGCAPMVQAWQQGQDDATPVQPDTLFTVLATGDPGPAYRTLKAASDRYGGAMVAVDDGEAFRAMRRVARVEGLSMEPAASVAFAGVSHLLEGGYITAGERVVINCSGHTFSAEKHTLEDRYVLHLETAMHGSAVEKEVAAVHHIEGLAQAFNQLDEQITSIVIIDDNPHDSRLIRRLLQSYKNYRVFEAHDGKDGIDLVRQRQPDLVVLDLTIPEIDGFTVLSTLKADERTRSIPVMIISAKTLTPDERRLLTRYSDSVWQKGSFNVQDLMEHVVSLLGGESEAPDEPLTTTPRQIAEGVSEALRWATTSTGETVRPRILVVDDNVLDARLMRRLFESRQRFDVREVHSAADAVKAMNEGRPDLIILDLILPDRSGDTLLRDIRADARLRDVPVIIVTARPIEGPLRVQLTEMADSVWDKSTMDRSSLLARVESVLTS